LAIDKIKRNFVWLRKVLGIIDKTTLPGEILGEVRPTLDTFGWDQLQQPSAFGSTFAVAPATSTAAAVTPEGFLRVYFHAAVRHTDTGVDHFLWIEKVLANTGQVIEITPPNIQVPVGVPQSATQWIMVEAGATIRGRTDIPLVAGAIALNVNFVDLPSGEYIQR